MRALEGNFPLRFANDETIAHYNRCTGSNPAPFFVALDTLISEIKSDGFWSSIGLLHLLHGNKADSFLNIAGISAGGDATEWGSGLVSFTANVGLLCQDGVSNSAIKLGETTSSLSTYSLEDAHFWSWSDNATVERVHAADADASGVDTYADITSSAQHTFLMHSASGTTVVTGGTNNGEGFVGQSIIASNARYYMTPWGNGSDTTSRTGVMANQFFFVGDKSSAGTIGNGQTFKGFGAGAGLSQTELIQLEGHISAFMADAGYI